jgi:hypothetical protein
MDIKDKHLTPKWGLKRVITALVLIYITYIGGYFILMDRSRPTAFGEFKNYQSSFRWAGPMPDKDGRPTKFPDTSIWNLIYGPMDDFHFKYFPRSREEREKLRDYGYDLRDVK